MASNRKQIFVFDIMRNRSHLVFRYLGTHPDIRNIWHPFLPAFLSGPERIFQYTVNIDKDGNDIGLSPLLGDVTYAEATKKFVQAIKDAEDQGKIPVAKEHTQNVHKQEITFASIRNEPVDIPVSSNPTVIPDHIFATLTPLFIIRKPVFSVPSNYIAAVDTTAIRPGGEDWKLMNAVPLQRQLFDHFCKRDGHPPFVVDGDDVIWRNEEVRDKLAQFLDIDPQGFSQTWQPVPEDERSEDTMLRYFLQTIDDSTGIERNSEEPPDPDLNKAYTKWSAKYGQEVADQLRGTVEGNMPHYEHMARFKI